MNKLMGFFELNDLDLPTIPWKEYTGSEFLDKSILWTVRSAVYKGNDLNLPRKIGVSADEAMTFATKLLHTLAQNGIVIYYPYFLANKSGTLEVRNKKTIIEAVNADLWNLVSLSDRDVTIEIDDGVTSFHGDETFLSESEITKIVENVPKIRQSFRNQLIEGHSLLLEWSYAQRSNLQKMPIGNEYLVFYELRTI
ncbi:hypothetical protein [Acutalibacter muris]|jgi:hypothetical protein|uniref:hypothetical protein n=1 Tax=Acutalibacter muris TaxID=1796620 RepID=UPI00272EB9A7|nr:hypothetical protein [Acutalibacter muris]